MNQDYFVIVQCFLHTQIIWIFKTYQNLNIYLIVKEQSNDPCN
jgi:hypothetical protein